MSEILTDEEIVQTLVQVLESDEDLMRQVRLEADRIVTEAICGRTIKEMERTALVETLECTVIDAAIAYDKAKSALRDGRTDERMGDLIGTEAELREAVSALLGAGAVASPQAA